MNRHKPDKVAESERETEIALFRYGLIAPLLFAAPESGPLEATLRQIAGKSYQIPYSGRRRVSVSTLRRYLALYREGGFDALRPRPRADKGSVKAFPPEVLEAAIALRQQQPARTTPMLVELLQRDPNLKLDQPINAHTLTTQLRQRGHSRRQLGQATRTYRRFERDHSNSLWQGDAMVGPWLPDPNVPGKKRRAHLFCFLDDHSRLVVSRSASETTLSSFGMKPCLVWSAYSKSPFCDVVCPRPFTWTTAKSIRPTSSLPPAPRWPLSASRLRPTHRSPRGSRNASLRPSACNLCRRSRSRKSRPWLN